MIDRLRNEILTWFVAKGPRGSQAGDPSRSVARAADELRSTIQIDPDSLRNEIENLCNRGCLEIVQGDGLWRGAWILRITQRGRDLLYPQDDMDALVGALQELAAAIRENSSDLGTAESIEHAAHEAATIKAASENILTTLRNASASVKTVAALKPAYNTAVQVANALGLHGLHEIP